MHFIDISVSFLIVFLIYYILFISSENCNNLVDLIATNEVYVLNKSETVTFYPTDFEFLLTEYDGEWYSSGNCSMTNAPLFKNNRLT